MEQTVFLKSKNENTTIGHLLGVPLVARGWTWLPAAQVFCWGIMTVVAGVRHPSWSFFKRAGSGLLTMVVMLGSEWTHNLAHAAAARKIGKPVDGLRIVWGMPLLVYLSAGEQDVRPQEHLLRALGGPVWNMCLWTAAFWARKFTQPETLSRDAADAAYGMNAFISGGSLLPIPEFDGGSMLKWSLVKRGKTVYRAEQIVQQANRVVGAGLIGAAMMGIGRKKWILGAVCGLLGGLAIAAGWGILKNGTKTLQ